MLRRSLGRSIGVCRLRSRCERGEHHDHERESEPARGETQDAAEQPNETSAVRFHLHGDDR